MLKIAIVEDERECQEALIEHLRKYEKEKNEAFIVRIFNDGIDILDDYSADYDLIFLDIHMKYQDGMTTAKRIREVDADAQIVFITALAQYAIEGYKVNALDFILKPVVYEQLAMTMDKVLAVTSKYHREKQLLVAEGERKCKISTEDILYIEVVGHDMFFHTKDKVYSKHGIPLKTMADELAEYYFAKSGQSQLVNLRYVDEVKKDTVYASGDRTLYTIEKKKTWHGKSDGNHNCGYLSAWCFTHFLHKILRDGNAAGDFVGGIRHSYVCVVCFDMGDTDFFNLFLYGKQYL